MFKKIVLSTVIMMPGTVFAAAPSIPTENYVQGYVTKVNTETVNYIDTTNQATIDYVDSDKVSIAQTAEQQMAGTYTVTGTLNVPTPALPTIEE